VRNWWRCVAVLYVCTYYEYYSHDDMTPRTFIAENTLKLLKRNVLSHERTLFSSLVPDILTHDCLPNFCRDDPDLFCPQDAPCVCTLHLRVHPTYYLHLHLPPSSLSHGSVFSRVHVRGFALGFRRDPCHGWQWSYYYWQWYIIATCGTAILVVKTPESFASV
jgi:hypothetical protein